MTILAFPDGIGSHSSRTTNSVGPTCDNAYDTLPATSVSTTFAEYGAITAKSESQLGIYYADARPSNIDCGASTKDDPDWDKEPELDYSQYEDEPDEEQ
jgi:hypothetical protein